MDIPAQENFVEVNAHGLRWHVASDFAEALNAVDLDRVCHPDRLREGELVKDNTARTVARLPHPLKPEGPALYVKRYKLKGFVRGIKHLVLPTQAAQEHRVSQALISHGIPTCRTLAVAERRRWLLPSEAFLISREIPGVVTFRQWAAGGGWRAADKALKMELIEELGGLVVRMVRSGACHGDFHVGNILMAPNAPAGRRFFVVDLHRVRLGTATRHGLVRMFRFLAASSKKYGVSSAERVRFMRLVLEELKKPEELTQDELRWWTARVRSSWRKQHRRYMNSHTRHCVQECKEFARDSIPGFKVWRRRDFPLEAALAAVRCHQETMEGRGRGEVRKRGNRAQIALCPARPGETVCVKAFLRRRLGARIKDLLRPTSRAKAAWIAHRGMNVRSVPAALGLALLESTNKLAGQPDYLVVEALPFEGRLDQVAPQLPQGGSDRRELARQVAGLFRLLADNQVRHPDTKATNILVGRDAAGFRLWFTDLDRVQFNKPWPRHRWVRHLAHCNARVPTAVTLLDRMRCLREIARGLWTDKERLQVARDILAETPQHDPVWLW